MDSASHRYHVPVGKSTARGSQPGSRGLRFTSARRLLARLGSASVIAAMAALLLAAAPVAAAGPHKLFVSPSGSDGGPCSWRHPCLTIGHAIDVAAPRSKIVVRAGTYHEAVVIDKQLRLIGHHAVIDASGLMADVGIQAGPFKLVGWALLINGPGSAGTVVKGFTVEHAAAEGILAFNTSDVTIKHNELTGNDQAKGLANPPDECVDQGPVPGDCGEALHLLSVVHSRLVRNNVHDNVGGILLTDEAGPTHGNLVAYNTSKNNLEDCGITLPSHNPMATTDPSLGGVYDNTILGNWSIGNGGAGVGMFAAGPGMASYNNRVIGNVLRDNGEAGVGIHSHAPDQNVSGNLIAANWISGNGIDPDFQTADPAGPHDTGIAIGSVAVPVSARVLGNWISNEYWGIYSSGSITIHGLWSNHFTHSVAHHTN